MSDEKGSPVDVLAWQEVLYRLQHLESKVFDLQDELLHLKKEAVRQPKTLTWRDMP